jgi:hypothetical protein
VRLKSYSLMSVRHSRAVVDLRSLSFRVLLIMAAMEQSREDGTGCHTTLMLEEREKETKKGIVVGTFSRFAARCEYGKRLVEHDVEAGSAFSGSAELSRKILDHTSTISANELCHHRTHRISSSVAVLCPISGD